MEWLADKLTIYIINKKVISRESYKIYCYGFLTGMEMILCVMICTIIAVYLKSFGEFLILITVFFSLRAYVGGIHLKHYFLCLICSCFVITFLLVASHLWVPNEYVAATVTSFTAFLIIKLAPLATRERIGDPEEAAFFNKQRKHIFFVIALLDLFFLIFDLDVFWSLIMYTMLVVLFSMLLGLYKSECLKGN